METACSSTDLSYEEPGQRTAAVSGLQSSQSSHGEEPISSPTALGEAQQDPRNA